MFIILFGLAIIALAAFGLFHGYSANDWTMAGLSFGGIIVGTLVTLFGFGKRASENMDQPHAGDEEYAQAEIRALVQSMGVMAVADERIRDQEVAAIARMHEQMLGVNITDREVREILSEFGPDFDITKRLVEDRAKISPSMKRIIVQSCHLVMVSDLEIVRREETKIREIGLALGFDQSEVDDLIASAAV